MDLEYKPHLVPQKCPVCDAAREKLSYMPLTADERRTVIHLTCASCRSNLFAFATQNEMGILTVGILTDLSSQEARSFFGVSAVTGEDVLTFHKQLQEKKHLSVRQLLAL